MDAKRVIGVTGMGVNLSHAQFKRLLLDYEIRGSWWAQWVSFGPLQALAGKYFARKVNRKYARLLASHEMQKRLKGLASRG